MFIHAVSPYVTIDMWGCQFEAIHLCLNLAEAESQHSNLFIYFGLITMMKTGNMESGGSR